MPPSPERSVVVTGLGAVSPAGVGIGPLWQAARDGQSCGGSVVGFDLSGCGSRIAAELPAFDPLLLGLSASQVRRTDRVAQLALVAAAEAVASAGLSARGQDPWRIGVLLGTAIGGVGFMERAFRRCCVKEAAKPRWVRLTPDPPDAELYGGFSAQSISTEVAVANGFQGFNTTMVTGCTAGLDAIGAAAAVIQRGAADVMITGGADAPITPIVFGSFDVIHCLSRRNHDPARASRPFDRDRDGFLLAEGCGVLVLESEQHARRRGAPILARIIGYASRSNAYHMTALPGDGSRLAATISEALRVAGVSADEVDYVNAHGSSTPQNDRNETSAFKQVFGSRAYEVPISSTKSVLGHALGAASALESVVCVRALMDQVVPPTANYDNRCADCDLDYVPNQPRQYPLRLVECNASGFSGIHSAALYASLAFRH